MCSPSYWQGHWNLKGRRLHHRHIMMLSHCPAGGHGPGPGASVAAGAAAAGLGEPLHWPSGTGKRDRDRRVRAPTQAAPLGAPGWGDKINQCLHLETPESLDMVYTWYILGIYFQPL
jgi:hypothetical protein